MSWEELAEWWLDEVSDPAYAEVVTPMLLEMLALVRGDGVLVDLGSGDGRLIPVVEEATGAMVIGVELVEELARRSDSPVVVCRLPAIPLATASLDGAYAVLVLDHVEDHEAFFAESARAVRPGGFLVIISNHPMWTAPGSTPISDSDGEVLWRPGRYFGRGASVEPAAAGRIVFFHRSMADLVNAASESGWRLVNLVEKPSHLDDKDPGIPRLLAVRWRRDDTADRGTRS